MATTVSQPAPMVEIINNDYRCLPCVAICNTRQMLESHLSGKKHVAKIALCGGADNFKPIADLPDLPTENLTPAGKKRKNISAQGNFRCDLCEIDFPSAFPFESHMQVYSTWFSCSHVPKASLFQFENIRRAILISSCIQPLPLLPSCPSHTPRGPFSSSTTGQEALEQSSKEGTRRFSDDDIVRDLLRRHAGQGSLRPPRQRQKASRQSRCHGFQRRRRSNGCRRADGAHAKRRFLLFRLRCFDQQRRDS